MNASLPTTAKIPCSVGVLTLNREGVLAAALESVREFADVYICDGNSTDRTQEIARSFGARITRQRDTDESNQRITSFGEARTRCVEQAEYEWYFRLDSDEELSAEAVAEIRKIVTGAPTHAVWRIPRRYVIAGKMIDQAITYPNYEIRLFRRDAVEGYVKATHERVVVKPGQSIGTMQACMHIPLPDTYEEFWKKFESGLRFDAIHHRHIGLYSWVYGSGHVIWSCLVYTLKLIRAQFAHGTVMPLRYEWARYRYQGRVWLLITKAFFSNVWRVVSA